MRKSFLHFPWKENEKQKGVVTEVSETPCFICGLSILVCPGLGCLLMNRWRSCSADSVTQRCPGSWWPASCLTYQRDRPDFSFCSRILWLWRSAAPAPSKICIANSPRSRWRCQQLQPALCDRGRCVYGFIKLSFLLIFKHSGM